MVGLCQTTLLLLVALIAISPVNLGITVDDGGNSSSSGFLSESICSYIDIPKSDMALAGLVGLYAGGHRG